MWSAAGSCGFKAGRSGGKFPLRISPASCLRTAPWPAPPFHLTGCALNMAAASPCLSPRASPAISSATLKHRPGDHCFLQLEPAGWRRHDEITKMSKDMAAATLKIFLVHGDPKRLRTVELSNWTGKAVAGPRSEFDNILQREESLSSGVYFLTGIDPETGNNAIYIGEAECIRDRVKAHTSKDFWNTITFFVSKDESLTKAHVRYLEGRLIGIARSTERADVKNGQSSGSKLPESDREDMEVFLGKMQQVLPIVGIEAFL